VCYNEDKNRLLSVREHARVSLATSPAQGFRAKKGGIMNRIEKKETVVYAAKLFEEEVRELMPDIPRKELCDMVDDFIYYQTDDLSKKEADAIVGVTCTLS